MKKYHVILDFVRNPIPLKFVKGRNVVAKMTGMKPLFYVPALVFRNNHHGQ